MNIRFLNTSQLPNTSYLPIPHNKGLTQGTPIITLPIPSLLKLPALPKPHLPNNMPRLLVNIGDYVQCHQPLAQQAPEHFTAHAPMPGHIVDITYDKNPYGYQTPLIHILFEPPNSLTPSSSANNQFASTQDSDNSNAGKPFSLTKTLAAYGIYGLGGAGFPTHTKLAKAKNSATHLIVNIVECDPYVTSDEALLLHKTDTIFAGIRRILSFTGIQEITLATRSDKPLVIDHLKKNPFAMPGITCNLLVMPDIFPAGTERLLTQVITGKTYAKSEHSLDLGVLCMNVSTIYAIENSLQKQQPLTHRVVTISGQGVHKPCIVEAPIGMKISDLLTYADYDSTITHSIKTNSLLSSNTITDTSQPIHKTTYCVLALTEDEVKTPETLPCIGCNQCNTICPSLIPVKQMHLAEFGQSISSSMLEQSLYCIDCGLCDLVCPSHIPLASTVERIKHQERAKNYVKKRKQEAIEDYEKRNLRIAEAKSIERDHRSDRLKNKRLQLSELLK